MDGPFGYGEIDKPSSAQQLPSRMDGHLRVRAKPVRTPS